MLSFKDIQWEVGSPWRWGLSILFFISKDVLRRVLVYTKEALLGGIGGGYIFCVCMM